MTAPFAVYFGYMTQAPDPPNPGSDAALDLGCTCPIFDNNRGKQVPWQGGYIIVQGCPVHDPGEDLDEGAGDSEALLSYPPRRDPTPG